MRGSKIRENGGLGWWENPNWLIRSNNWKWSFLYYDSNDNSTIFWEYNYVPQRERLPIYRCANTLWAIINFPFSTSQRNNISLWNESQDVGCESMYGLVINDCIIICARSWVLFHSKYSMPSRLCYGLPFCYSPFFKILVHPLFTRELYSPPSISCTSSQQYN